jgi:hypothetical protein
MDNTSRHFLALVCFSFQVVLVEMPKREAEDLFFTAISGKRESLLGSKVIFRSGSPQVVASLHLVGKKDGEDGVVVAAAVVVVVVVAAVVVVVVVVVMGLSVISRLRRRRDQLWRWWCCHNTIPSATTAKFNVSTQSRHTNSHQPLKGVPRARSVVLMSSGDDPYKADAATLRAIVAITVVGIRPDSYIVAEGEIPLSQSNTIMGHHHPLLITTPSLSPPQQHQL